MDQEQSWKAYYRAAMLEVDLSLLHDRIQHAEKAIEAHKAELAASSDSRGEIREMSDALQNLRVLKRELSTPAPSVVDGNHSHPELEGTYVAFVSASRRYVAVTDGVCALTGYSREELLTMAIEDLAAPELQPTVPETFQHYVKQGQLHGEFTLLSKDGQRIPIFYEAMIFPDGCMTARWHPLKKQGISTELKVG